MTVDEKKELYALLRTVASSLYGCAPREYEHEPVFAELPHNTAPEPHSAHSAAPVPADAPASLDAVAAAVRQCRKCGLYAQRHNTVPGTGCTAPVVLVIGEGPGA